MLKLFLWLRYLRKRKIVFLSIAAVALSVSLLVVVASLFTGFINAYEQIAVEFLGDMVFEPPTKFSKYPAFIERLEKLGAVQTAAPTLSAQGILYLGKGNVRAVQIQGIDLARTIKVTGLGGSLLKQKDPMVEPTFAVPGHPEAIGGFVGIATVKEPDEETDEYDFAAAQEMLGQQVVLTTGSVAEQAESSQDDLSSAKAEFKRRTMKLAVADIVFTGFYDLDKGYAFVPIDALQTTLYPDQPEPLAEMIQVKLTAGTDVESARAQILGVWAGFVDDQLKGDPYLKNYATVETAVEMQSRYIAEVRKQMGLLLVIFGVVSGSVVVLVFCIFYMIVTTKRRDIAIIKSCGTASASVGWIFVGFGVCIGVIGSGIGSVLAYLITRNINTIEGWIRIIFGLKLWKSSIYMFAKIPSEVNWCATLWSIHLKLYGWQFGIKFKLYDILWLAIVAAALGTLIPAVVAAITKPVDILRYE
jgi:lipoprotein-releasing system permease protein